MKQFSRYENCEAGEDNGLRMPLDVLDAKVQALCISEVLGRLEDFNDGVKEMYPWAERFVMGYPLAPWQRPLVWTVEQKRRFILSIWSGVDIGSYMMNDIYEFKKNASGVTYLKEFSEVILDGQQRLSAIEGYVTNAFSVPDANGSDVFWADLPRIERRRFGTFHFGRSVIRSWNEKDLRMAYDLRAFGGTAHTEDQRASDVVC
jgi:hypothetical protein